MVGAAVLQAPGKVPNGADCLFRSGSGLSAAVQRKILQHPVLCRLSEPWLRQDLEVDLPLAAEYRQIPAIALLLSFGRGEAPLHGESQGPNQGGHVPGLRAYRVIQKIKDTVRLASAGMAYQGTQLNHGGLGVVISPPLQSGEDFRDHLIW